MGLIPTYPMPPTATMDAATSAENDTDNAAAFAEPSLEDLSNLLNGTAPAAARRLADDEDPDSEDLDAEPAASDAETLSQDEAAPAADDEPEALAAEASNEDPATAAATEDDDDAPETEELLDEEGQKARAKFNDAQQRIFDREVAKVKRKALSRATTLEQSMQEREQQLTALQAEVEQLRATPAAAVAASAEQPLAGVDDLTALDDRLTQARQLRKWARANSQGAYVDDGKGGTIDISAERAQQMLAEAEDLIEVHAPKRRAFIDARQKARQAEVQLYPHLKDSKHPDTVMIEAALRQHPALREMVPDIRAILADAIVGRRVTLEGFKKQQAARAPSTAPAGASRPVAAKAPASPAGGTRAPTVKASTKRRTGALQRFAETGSDPDNGALAAILTG